MITVPGGVRQTVSSARDHDVQQKNHFSDWVGAKLLKKGPPVIKKQKGNEKVTPISNDSQDLVMEDPGHTRLKGHQGSKYHNWTWEGRGEMTFKTAQKKKT